MQTLVAMFAEDGSLAIAILGVVALAAMLSFVFHLPPLLTGGTLLVGCVLALLENVLRARRND